MTNETANSRPRLKSLIPDLQLLITSYQLPIFLLAFCARLLPGPRTIDDAYITFRYARNLLNGVGLVYNAGEYVLGTTTPLYTLLLATLSLILHSSDFPTIALWVNALADGLTCALLISLGKLLSGQQPVGVATALLYAVAPFSVTFAIGGMETSLFVLWITTTALLYLRRHPAFALGAALALLTRPDALIFILPLFAFQLLLAVSHQPSAISKFRSLISSLQSPIFFLLALTPWLIFATYYYGSPLPHSITAKGFAYQLQPQEGFVRLWQHYANPFMEFATLEKIPFGNFWVLPGLILYATLSLIAILNLARRDVRALAITLYPFLYFITFAIANPLIFRWYLTPPLPIYFILIFSGISVISNQSTVINKQNIPTSDLQPLTSNLQLPISNLQFLIPCAIFIFFSLRAWVLTPDHGPARPAPDMAWFKLEELYTQIGLELAPQIDTKTVIAAGDIGALGYFSNARILDTVGLISAQTPRYYPLPNEQLVINYAIAAQLIADQQPDYVVFLEVYGRRTLLKDENFLRSYELRKKIPTDIYGSDGMLIYKKK